MSEHSTAGGSFLIENADPQQAFTPEDFTSEHLAIARAALEFVQGEVLPKTEAIERHESGLMPELLRKAGALGLLGIDVPEQYGGLGLDLIASCVVSECLARQASFSVSHMVHTGIGTLPLVYCGNEEQKRKYLPKLASGEMIGAYALSEASAGSDALASQTRATLSPDGTHYILNGVKMWTSNGGFADLFTVFARTDNGLSAFLVERTFPGVSVGREEHKLGIKGSSTTRIALDDAQVPKENLLYQEGRGHVVALNILNIGRFKLAVTLLGAAKESIATAAQYARERKQFGRPIAEFGLIQHKLAEMAVRLFASESACYRVAEMIQNYHPHPFPLPSAGEGELPSKAKPLEEYLIECAILKVHASEMLDYVVDEALQIHGGYGYTEEFPAARAYRDARINRIYEGTNEMNRLTVAQMILRRRERGRLSLDPSKLAAPRSGDPRLEREQSALHHAKKITLLTLDNVARLVGNRLAEEEEIAGALADMLIQAFVMESALSRAEKQAGAQGRASAQQPESNITMASVGRASRPPHGRPEACPTISQIASVAATKLLCHDGLNEIERLARIVLAAIVDGRDFESESAILSQLAMQPRINVIDLRRQLARAVMDSQSYPF